MKLILEQTTQVVTVFNEDGAGVECRVWEGKTESGVKVEALIVRIAARDDQDLTQLQNELKETRPPSDDVRAFPLRLIL
jgi:hypothetical protein